LGWILEGSFNNMDWTKINQRNNELNNPELDDFFTFLRFKQTAIPKWKLVFQFERSRFFWWNRTRTFGCERSSPILNFLKWFKHIFTQSAFICATN
jgi:hypothetical protein